MLVESAPRPKVMIVSDDPMGGHRAAARAVREALDEFKEVDSKSYEFHDMCAKLRRFVREEQV